MPLERRTDAEARPFADRREAGRALVPLVRPLAGPNAILLALPRGGVPVADEVRRALGIPLDVVVIRKLGAPGNPEYGVGAIASGGVYLVNDAAIRSLGLTEADLAPVIAEERRELARREREYRGDSPPPDLAGKTVILVDDGLATGVTARAAAQAVRKLGASRVVLAVPVGAAESLEAVRAEFDEVLCAMTPPRFRAVGEWYRDFGQTTDEEVASILGARPRVEEREVRIPLPGGGEIVGDLTLVAGSAGLVVFAHGSGSGRKSPRNREVARGLQEAGHSTLLLDLLTMDEEERDLATREHRFDIALLASRVESAITHARRHDDTRRLAIGLFGSSTGAAAALVAASRRPDEVRAVVSRGGRPDLAGDALDRVRAPSLLVVGSRDEGVIELNEAALARLPGNAEMKLVEGATHLFEEPGALEQVTRLAAGWFRAHFSGT